MSVASFVMTYLDWILLLIFVCAGAAFCLLWVKGW